MIKRYAIVVLIMCLFLRANAEEGMWLPSLIGQTKLEDMKSKGLKLSAEDLYSINQSSLKDAIASIGGCTGEMISNNGLMLTNHHCGYNSIQFHSSVDKDYLTNGFWAMTLKEELPSPGMFASFLVRMDDVTDAVNQDVNPKWSKLEQEVKRKNNITSLINNVTKDNHYSAKIESLYYANQYFMFVYETFNDVRLVGTPPSAIGKFGGDTDNWMWPRHTGDFCLFRVYASKDNTPAAYSQDNIPYTPKKSLTISTNGVNKGDFTFIYGYPGRTSEYIMSDAVKYIAEKTNSQKIKLRTIRLNTMNEYQSKDVETRIKYAAKNAGVSNAWKKWIGERDGILKLGVIAEKEELEAEFIRWSKDKKEYNDVVGELKKLYQDIEPLNYAFDFYNETVNAIEIIGFAKAMNGYVNSDTLDKKSVVDNIRSFFKNYYEPIDRDIAVRLIKEFNANIDKKYIPLVIDTKTIFENTILTDSARLIKAADNEEEFKRLISSDSIVKLSSEYTKFYDTNVIVPRSEMNTKINDLYSKYMRGLMEMQPQKTFYPDANSTLRIAYGNVDGFHPRDGVNYDHVSTIEGIIEKDNPEIYDYAVPSRLKELYKSKDYGRWGVDGTIPVAFLATNHTSGGNSGSPVLNANGELIGLNFDRCWESTMSDIKYDKDLCRNIAVDVRYILFIIDKYAGAGYLIDEMQLNINK